MATPPTPVWYVGPAGRMQRLRAPRRDYSRAADAQVTTYQLTGGGQATDRAAIITRQFQYQWAWLSPAEWGVLTALFTGQYGPGPYTLLDGGTANYLTRSQASGGTAGRDVSGFAVVGGGESVALATTPTDVGDRSVAWSVPSPATSGILRVLASSPDLRTYRATPPGITWCCWARLRATSAVRGHMRLSWYDAAGALLSTVDAPNVAFPTTSWGRFPVIGCAPPTAVFFEPQVVLDTSSVAAPTTVSWGRGRLLVGRDDQLWMPGEDLPLVTIPSHAETVPIYDKRTPTLTLLEVG